MSQAIKPEAREAGAPEREQIPHETGTAPEEVQPDAHGGDAPSQQERRRDEDSAFEELIRGQYKASFDRRVQRILEGRLKNLKQSVQQRQQAEERERGTSLAQVARLEQSEADIREVYPAFDWKKEMRTPQFARLIAAGVDGRTAYEAVHCGELLGQAVRYGAQRAGEVFSASVASGGRIAENGGSHAGTVSRIDPKALTGAELADIRRRVMRGEKIRL